jgi:hypothetical protein
MYYSLYEMISHLSKGAEVFSDIKLTNAMIDKPLYHSHIIKIIRPLQNQECKRTD